jgi:hypothetical protein
VISSIEWLQWSSTKRLCFVLFSSTGIVDLLVCCRERNLRFPWTIMEQVRSQLVAIQDTNEVIDINPHAQQEADDKKGTLHFNTFCTLLFHNQII